jgi:uncharacterized protein (UPF0248 family)
LGISRTRIVRFLCTERVFSEERDNMQPLQELLNRITWDPEFGKDRFAIGYEDRLMSQEMVVPFAAVRLDPERPGMLSIHQEDGFVAHIPLHRVRTVYRNGEAIWQRPARPPRG